MEDPNDSFDAIYQALMLPQQQQQQQEQPQPQWRGLLQQPTEQEGDYGSFNSPMTAAQHENLRTSAPLGGDAYGREQARPAYGGGVNNNNNNNNNNSLLLFGSSFPMFGAQEPTGMDDSLRNLQFDPTPFAEPLRPAENPTSTQLDPNGSRDLQQPPYLEGAAGVQSIPPYVMMMSSGAFTEESSRRLFQVAASASEQQQYRPISGPPPTPLVPGDEDFRGAMNSAQAEYLNSASQLGNDAPSSFTGHQHHHHSHRRATSSNSSKSASDAAAATEKGRFVLFVKILLKCLDRPGDGSEQDARDLKQVAKATILECTRRNRMGDSSYTPLLDALERRLRSTVGDDNWYRAARLCDRYLERRRSSPQIPVAAV